MDHQAAIDLIDITLDQFPLAGTVREGSPECRDLVYAMTKLRQARVRLETMKGANRGN